MRSGGGPLLRHGTQWGIPKDPEKSPPKAPKAPCYHMRDATKLISDLSARGNPRVRLARDQCIPPGALLTGGLGKAKRSKVI